MIVWLLTSCVLAAKAASVGDNSPAMYDVIVIGMGASGTTAATTLARAGRKVLGLEAQNRIGGRVKTVPFGDGVVEVGAEWIHGRHPSRVYDLAVAHNVSVLSQDISMEAYRSDGSKADNDVINELTNYALQVVEDRPVKPQPLGEFITGKIMDYIKEKHPSILEDQDFVTEYLAFLDLVVDNYEATTNWNDVTTDSKYEELEGDQHMSWHRNGYKTLFEILLNTYNNGSGLPNLEYKLNTDVMKIEWPQEPSEKVVVTCKDGATYTANNVIVTVSVGVLKDRYLSLFSPPLPKPKVDAIQNIRIGVEGKIIFLFPDQWWGETQFFEFIWRGSDKIKVQDQWLTHIAEASHPMGANSVLSLWLSGDYEISVETLPDDVVKRKCMELIRRFMGANVTVPEPIDMIRSNWYSNPYTRGSYTYDHISSPLHPTARSDLAEPLTDSSGKPRVLFAGEATNPTHFSTVHGAVETGHREAMRLLPSSKI